MEEQTSSSSSESVTSSATPAAAAAPAPAAAVVSSTPSTPSAAPSSVSSPSTASTPGAEQVQAAWTPDYKFKYMDESDTRIEGEIDEWARGMLTKENEENIKKIWSKAHGLDFVKKQQQKIREEYNGYKQKTEPLMKSWDSLSGLYNKGDIGGFLKGLNVPKEKVFQYVLDELNYSQLPEDQKRMKDEFNQYRQQAAMLEEQNRTLQEQHTQVLAQTMSAQLDSVLNKPEVKQVADAFDARMGKPGSFYDEVRQVGITEHKLTGRNISPEEAVGKLLRLVGTTIPQSAAPSGASTQSSAPPVIPNVQGKNSSPVKRVFTSTDEMRKFNNS